MVKIESMLSDELTRGDSSGLTGTSLFMRDLEKIPCMLKGRP